MTDTEPTTFTIRSESDLGAFWSSLLRGQPFDQRSLWLVFLDDDEGTLPLAVPIDDLPLEPDAQFTGNLAHIVADVTRSDGPASVVVLLSRPGAPVMNASDRRWAVALRDALGNGLMHWPVHLSTRGGIQVFAPDDLIGAA